MAARSTAQANKNITIIYKHKLAVKRYASQSSTTCDKIFVIIYDFLIIFYSARLTCQVLQSVVVDRDLLDIYFINSLRTKTFKKVLNYTDIVEIDFVAVIVYFSVDSL